MTLLATALLVGLLAIVAAFLARTVARPVRELLGLVIIAVVNSLVSVYYYLRVIYLMYMKEEWEETTPFKVPVTISILLLLTFIFTIWLGIFPGGLLEIAGAASNPF